MLVEDSEDDVILFQLTLGRSGLHESFELVLQFPNGEQAIDYFLNDPKTSHPESFPDILLLDIKLPGRSGFDVLARFQPLLPRLVIAMFTTSILESDRQKAELLGADLFQSKTFDLAEFSRFLNRLARLADQRRPKGETGSGLLQI